MVARKLDFDCVVLGGGAVGTLTAMLAAERGRRCLVIRLSDRLEPEAETLRNQAWLQSGAMFSRLPGESVPSTLSLKLRAQGQRLISELNLARVTERGLARFPESQDDEIESFIEAARELGMGASVRRLNPKDARERTGVLHREGTICVEVPDAPFDEAGMLVTARARVSAAGVHFAEVSEPVRVEPGKDAQSWRLIIEGDKYTAPRLVLAAGIGNLDCLDALGVDHQLIVKSTPLLVIPHSEGIKAPILIDRSQKLAVACHQRRFRPPHGCLVAGVYVGTEIPSSRLRDRAIPESDWSQIYQVLPARLQASRGNGHRFTCGHEVMRTGDRRVRKEDLIVERIEAYRGVVLALPGRATLAYHAAERALGLLDLDERSVGIRPIPAFDLGEAWTGSVHMHHEQRYDHLDDRAKE